MSILTKIIIVNLITLIRIIGTFIVLIMSKTSSGVSIGIMTILIYLSDVLDGVLARGFKVSTFFGALFDGAADKLFTVVNFIVLYILIGDLALIPLLIELLICIVQFIKYKFNMNIKSNIVGKIKVWFLAFSIVLTFFATDISNISFLTEEFINKVNSVDKNKLYLITLSPGIIMEFITLISYIGEFFFKKNIEASMKKSSKVKRIKLTKDERLNYAKNVWFSPEFYMKHKDETNLKDLRIEQKRMAK